MRIFIDALSNHVVNHLRLLKQLVMLSFQGRSVELHTHRGTIVDDGCGLCSQQFVCCPEERSLYLFVDKVMRLAGMIPVILVIATSDDFLVLDVGMSALRAIPVSPFL